MQGGTTGDCETLRKGRDYPPDARLASRESRQLRPNRAYGAVPPRETTLYARQTSPVAGSALDFSGHRLDRKSTRLNSSHSQISYAVFCLKKKIKKIYTLKFNKKKKQIKKT